MSHSKTYLKQVQELEASLRSGNISVVQRSLSKIEISKIPRPLAVNFANICRRAQKFQLALRILNPILRNKDSWIKSITDEELLEYSIVSLRNGALHQANSILEKIDLKKHPIGYLYKANCMMAKWNYKAAIDQLEKFMTTADSGAYQTWVAKVNLVAAYLFENKLSKARSLLKQLIHTTRQANAKLLYGNCCELFAQLEIQEKRWSQAEVYLARSENLLREASGNLLQVQKWRAVSETLKSGKVSSRLIATRKLALEYSYWEAVRDCDFYLALVRKDPERMAQVYFGTPFESFRYRTAELAKDFFNPDMTSILYDDDHKTRISKKYIVDVREGTLVCNSLRWKEPTDILHRLLKMFSSDRYKSFGVIETHSILEPGSYFSFPSSTTRTHQNLFRFRQWCHENQELIQIYEKQGKYRLRLRSDVGILVSRRKD